MKRISRCLLKGRISKKKKLSNTMAQRQRQRLRALRNDPNLRPYVQEGTATGEQLGTGSYGSVVEVRYLVNN